MPAAADQAERRSARATIGWGGGNAEELEGQDAFLAQARVERRLLAGRTNVSGQCGADVERVTLRTPRDVRTLVPSATGRAVLAVFDGLFVDGELELTYHLRGGKTVVDAPSARLLAAPRRRGGRSPRACSGR